jgi:3-ketosteroid 9alpha-monooxygenase subunit A
MPGWYVAVVSSELKNGMIRGFSVAGRDLVVFRTESGKVAVLDRYCVHQGASLELGKVVGERIRCAFHHWTFGTDGACTHIPACWKIPAGATMKTYPVTESWGFVWVYAGGDRPHYQLPEEKEVMPESDWFLAHAAYVDTAFTTCRDVFENSVDRAHSVPVHGSAPDSPLKFDMGPLAFKSSVSFLAFNDNRLNAQARMLAPSFWGTRLDGFLGIRGLNQENVWLNALQATGPNKTGVYASFYVRGRSWNPWARLVGKTIAAGWKRGFAADMPIWNNKVIRDNPILSPIDGPILQYRKWWNEQEERARSFNAAEAK